MVRVAASPGRGFWLPSGWLCEACPRAQDFILILQAIGMPLPHFLGWATILIEIVCGALVLAGAFLPLVAVPMIVVLLVAIFTVHAPNGFSSIKLLSFDALGAHFGQPGYETDLLYIASIVALCIGGAGPFSLDDYLARYKLRRPRAKA